jgi:hypothetical protein
MMELAQAPGVTLRQAPVTVSLVLAAKPFGRRGVIARRAPVAHFGYFRRGEQARLNLSHASLLPMGY